MESKKALLVASIGYVGTWVIVFLCIQASFLDDRTAIASIVTALMFALMFFYPPSAFSFIFHKQTKLKRWSYVGYGTIAAGLLFASWIFIDKLNGGGTGYDGLKYLVGLPVSFLISTLIIGIAAIAKNQKRITRILGAITLVGLIYWPIIIAIESILPNLLKFQNSFGILTIIPFWAAVCSALMATISAVFCGLKTKN